MPDTTVTTLPTSSAQPTSVTTTVIGSSLSFTPIQNASVLVQPTFQPSIATIPLPVPNVSTIPIVPNNAPQMTNQMTNIQALAQTLQSNSGGGNIIVLNVGNTNNLAATLSQLVSQNTLQAPSLGLAATQTPSTPLAVTTQASASNSPAATVSADMNIQPNAQALHVSQHVNQTLMQMPVQLPHQQSQEPAGYMIVPIPQVQSAQVNCQQPGITYPQQGLPISIQNQIQVQPQQHLQTVNPFSVQQHQQMFVAPSNVIHPHIVATNPQFIQQHPKSDELRSYLVHGSGIQDVSNPSFVNQSQTTHSSEILYNSTTKQSVVETVSLPTSHVGVSPPIFTSLNDVAISTSEGPSVHETPVIARSTIGNQIHSPPINKTTLHPPMSTQPNVSSPGLAFLAQVSSLTSGSQAQSLTYGNNSQTPSTGQNIQSIMTNEVHSQLPVLQFDDVKANVPAVEEPPTPGGSMTVSSTTKIGDDGIGDVPMIPANGDATCDSNIILSEIPEVEERNHVAVLKRKKEATTPPPVREKKKKGPAPKLSGNEVCLICSDKASGFHYNTLSCEGCKGFFRRTVIKGAKYTCKQSGDCTMDLYTRRKCQKCRFEKCKAVGMKEESVLSEEKLKAKKLKKEMDNCAQSMRALDDPTVPKLTSQQRSLLELLKANERRFQWPTADDVKKVTEWVEDDSVPHSRALRFAHFTEMCILIVQLVVEFTKQLPGFLSVLREDQIVLLKACAIEVMLLRAAKAYDKHDGTINFLNGKFYNKSSFYKAGIQVEFVDPIFQFCNSMAQLDLDETEYAILVAINTFSTDRPHIKDIGKVECMQDPYVELLRLYTRIRHPDDPLMFPRILMKIVELRTLNNYHSEQMFALKVQDQKLPPLLAEIWDM